MSAANPLRLLWLSGITTCSGPRAYTTDKLFQKNNITVNKAPENGEFTVYMGNPNKTIILFSHEADRFASASFESLLMEVPKIEHPRSIGWLLIRGYYSAFFAMHALLRIHGWACTRLSKNAVKYVNQDLNLYYPDAKHMESGFYLIQVQSGGRELVCKKMDASNGGSHEKLWSMLRFI